MLNAQREFDRSQKRLRTPLDDELAGGMSQISTQLAPTYTHADTTTLAETYHDTLSHGFENDSFRYAESASCMSTVNEIPQIKVRSAEAATEVELAVYKQYKLTAKDLQDRVVPQEVRHLPIYSMRESIINTIESNMVSIIRGETGSGKTTARIKKNGEKIHEKIF